MAHNNRKSSGHGVVTFNSYMTAATITAAAASTASNSKKKMKQTYWMPLDSGKRQTPQTPQITNPSSVPPKLKQEIVKGTTTTTTTARATATTTTRGKEMPPTKISFPYMQVSHNETTVLCTLTLN